MKLQLVTASLIIASAITPAFARPSTGISECDQFLEIMESCGKKNISSKEELKELDRLIISIHTTLKSELDNGKLAREDAKNVCTEGIKVMHEKGCK